MTNNFSKSEILKLNQEYFPHNSFRSNQEEFTYRLTENCLNQHNVVFSAQMGSGKTSMVLSAALTTAKLEKKQIIFCGRTFTQNNRVLEEYQNIQNNLNNSNQDIKILSLKGRIHMCPLKDKILNAKDEKDPDEKDITINLMEKCKDLREKTKDGCPFYKRIKKEYMKIKNVLGDSYGDDVWDEAWKLLSKSEFVSNYFYNFSSNIISAEKIYEWGSENNVCPYFFSKLLINLVDVVACSYLYMLHPFIRKAFYARNINSLENSILIFDECHNLIDTSNQIQAISLSELSLSRSKDYFKNLIKDEKENKSEIDNVFYDISAFQKIIDLIDGIRILAKKHIFSEKKRVKVLPQNIREKEKRRISFYGQIIKIEEVSLLSILRKIFKIKNSTKNQIIHILSENIIQLKQDIEYSLETITHSKIFPQTIISFIQQILDGEFDSSYGIFLKFYLESKKPKSQFSFKLEYFDSRKILKPVLNDCFASILMTGTYHEPSFKKLVGLEDADKKFISIKFPNIYPPENQKIICAPEFDFRVSNRDKIRFSVLKQIIEEFCKMIPKNIGIFCYSYDCIEVLKKNVFRNFDSTINKEIFYESRYKSASDVGLMVQDFKSHAKKDGAILIGVMGGRNSEGQDFPSDMMNGMIILGLNAPWGEIIKAKQKYYRTLFPSKGDIYAYEIPAIIKTMQTMGRLIRNKTDIGAILLLDDRYSWNKIKQEFPKDYKKKIEYTNDLLHDMKKIKEFVDERYNKSLEYPKYRKTNSFKDFFK